MMAKWILVVHVLCNQWHCHDENALMTSYYYGYDSLEECAKALTYSKMQTFEGIGSIMLCVPNTGYKNEK